MIILIKRFFMLCIITFGLCYVFTVYASYIPLETSSQSQPSSYRHTNRVIPAPYNNSQLPPVVSESTSNIVSNTSNDNSTMNIPSQINELRERVAKLQGIVVNQGHELILLKSQLNTRSRRSRLVTSIATSALAPNSSSSTQLNPNNDLIAYQSAFKFLINKEYDSAKEKFKDYINTFPNGKYVANSYYWLGEIFYIKMKYSEAKIEFRTLIAKFPKSNKVPDAMYKLGLIDMVYGNDATARIKFTQVVSKYPNSAASVLAKDQLEKFSKNIRAE